MVNHDDSREDVFKILFFSLGIMILQLFTVFFFVCFLKAYLNKCEDDFRKYQALHRYIQALHDHRFVHQNRVSQPRRSIRVVEIQPGMNLLDMEAEGEEAPVENKSNADKEDINHLP